MIDVHTHVLPHMDDGCRTTEESRSILRRMKRQGVTAVALTPHFYADDTSPQEFIERRERAFSRLTASGELPIRDLRLGAEVQYFEGVSRMDGLERFCIQGTGLLLLEMPFRPWSQRVLQEVDELCRRSDLTVVLAHIERYLPGQTGKMIEQICSQNLLVQANAEAFLSFRSRRIMLRMLDRGQIHLLGSDCHNGDSRGPNLAEGFAMIEKKRGSEAVAALEETERFFFAQRETV